MKKNKIISMTLSILLFATALTGCGNEKIEQITTEATQKETTSIVETVPQSSEIEEITNSVTEDTTSDAWPYGEIVDENLKSEFNLEVLDYDESYESFENLKFKLSNDIICVPSGTKFSSDSIEEVFTKEQLSQQAKTYSDIREWQLNTVTMNDKEFSGFAPMGFFSSTNSGEGKFHYFFITSPKIPTEYMITVGNTYYDKETNSVYIYTVKHAYGTYESDLNKKELSEMQSVCCWAYVFIEDNFDVENIYFIMPKEV